MEFKRLKGAFFMLDKKVFNNFSKISFISIFSFLVVGCSGNVNNEQKISTEVQNTIEENHKAQDHNEWHMSDSGANALFNNKRQEQASSKDSKTGEVLCDVLEKLPNDDLQVFEEEIYHNENSQLLESCANHLKVRIEISGEELRERLRRKGYATLDNVKRMSKETIFQYRDVSKGYKAYTGDVGPKQVVITLDDGPNTTNTPLVVEALQKAGAKAMFFMLGKNVEHNPELTQYIAQQGHSMANHSYSHPYMGSKEKCGSSHCKTTWVNPSQAVDQFRKTHQIIFDTLGYVDPFIRFPYGASVPELKSFLDKNSTAEFFWSADSLDWNMNYSTEQVLDLTMSQLRKKGRGIVLFHDIHRRTAELMPEFLNRLDNEGYQLVVLQPSDNRLKTSHPLISGHGPH